MPGATLRERVRELREEIEEIRRLNQEYRQQRGHSITEREKYSERANRLVAIALELARLKKEKAA
jgi:hypothetical protein